jgi:hypothetical protein
MVPVLCYKQKDGRLNPIMLELNAQGCSEKDENLMTMVSVRVIGSK